MKFGISYSTSVYGIDPDRIVAYAQHAEACGLESFFMPEHIALYPGAMLGGTTISPSLPIADPLQCLGFVAAATERILLGTAVQLVPYHHPVILAKTARDDRRSIEGSDALVYAPDIRPGEMVITALLSSPGRDLLNAPTVSVRIAEESTPHHVE
jgi:Luciferase-like monooxygenase